MANGNCKFEGKVNQSEEEVMTTKFEGKGTVVLSAVRTSQKTFAELLGAHVIEKTGNIVLEFAQAEVVVPRNWRMSKDLCIGDVIKAWWDEDGKFHLIHKG